LSDPHVVFDPETDFTEDSNTMNTTQPLEAAAETPIRTRVALLGTIGHLHAEPLKYDLLRLRGVVEEIEPDLLGVETDPLDWATGDLRSSPLEVREALVPATRRIDTVVVPLGGAASCRYAAPEDGLVVGLRSALIHALDRLLTALQRRAAGPEDIAANHFKHVCELVCAMEAAASTAESRLAWDRTNAEILNNVIATVRRDPGRRLLLAVQCRRLHWLELQLRRLRDEIQLVPLNAL
jgi:hypothetical protein